MRAIVLNSRATGLNFNTAREVAAGLEVTSHGVPVSSLSLPIHRCVRPVTNPLVRKRFCVEGFGVVSPSDVNTHWHAATSSTI